MFTIQKALLILSFFIIASLYAMKRNNESSPEEAQKANDELLQIIKAAKNNDNFHFQEEDWEKIKKCLENGAKHNLKATNFSETPLFCLAAKDGKKDICDYLLQRGANINTCDAQGWTPLYYFLFSKLKTHDLNLQYLIQHNANINHKSNSGVTPLGWAIYKDGIYEGKNSKVTETIKLLLQTGASIYVDNYGNTVFHKAVNNSEETIKTLMAHINFKNNDENIKNRINITLLVLNRLNNFLYQNLRFLILSKLLSSNFFHKGLYKELVNKGYNDIPLKLVNEHVQLLNQILQIKNQDNKTTLQKLSVLYPPPYNPPQNIKVLLDGNRLEKDSDILNATYPFTVSPDNLALQILENHYNLQR